MEVGSLFLYLGGELRFIILFAVIGFLGMGEVIRRCLEREGSY
jgi:hypothetical protein